MLSDVIITCRISANLGTSLGLFLTVNAVSNGEQEKIYYSCECAIEKSVPRDHRLSSHDKPRDAKR